MQFHSQKTGTGDVKFPGTAYDLRQAIAGAGIKVTAVEEGDNRVTIRTDAGGVCNLTPSTGNLVIEGKEKARESLLEVVTKHVERRSAKEAKAKSRPAAAPARKKSKKKIFIVHGHDHAARDQLELVIRELGLSPSVPARSVGGGTTVIEILERYIRPGTVDSAHFGIVLLTPDDMGHARKAGGGGSRPRARQNAVLELGMLIGALGRKNVAVLRTGGLELPSDIDGVLYLDYRDHVREIVPRLAQHLRRAGFVITAEALARAATS